jgi:hypothetical protein
MVFEARYVPSDLPRIEPSDLMIYKPTPFQSDADAEPNPSIFLDPLGGAAEQDQDPDEQAASCVLGMVTAPPPAYYGPGASIGGAAHNTIEEAEEEGSGFGSNQSVVKRLDYIDSDGEHGEIELSPNVTFQNELPSIIREEPEAKGARGSFFSGFDKLIDNFE